MIAPTYTAFRQLFATTTDRDLDGFEEWPVAKLNASGFDDGVTVTATGDGTFPVDVTVDAQAAGAMAYHVWLSQRTDDASLQYIEIVAKSGKSGTWTLSLTDKAVDDMGLDTAEDELSPEQLTRTLRFCWLYLQRISDDAIQAVKLADVIE